MTSSQLIFFVNGKKVIEKNVNPEWTLLFYLRNNLRLCGTKLGCGEGGCGACTVMVSRYDKNLQTTKHIAVNACLAPVCSMHGLAVTTIEGIGSTKTKLHPVQERIAKSHGLQCGFCTPGIVMSMYALLRNCSKPKMKDVETSFQGNLCRCTGYRPIIEGYKSFTVDGNKKMQNGYLNTNCKTECKMGKNCCKLNGNYNGLDTSEENKLYDASTFLPYDPTQEPIFPPELKLNDTLNTEDLAFRSATTTWYRPTTLFKLLELKHTYPEAKIVVGNTEVGVEMTIKKHHYSVLIQPNIIPELNVIEHTVNGIQIGAAVSLLEVGEILEKLIKSTSNYKTRIFVAIKDILHWFGGKQIRGVASIGGNIMTSSPISDLNPIFLAAGVQLELCSKQRGRRIITMNDNFFTGYRRNSVRSDEILVSVHIPFTSHSQYFCAYKQSRRRDDDIAIVNFALNVKLKPENNFVQDVRIAYGGMAATTVSARRTCSFLLNKPWNVDILNQTYKYLMDDLQLPPNAPGGMTEYRKALSLSLFFKGFLKIIQHLELYMPSSDQSAINDFQDQIPKSSQYFNLHPLNGKIRAVGEPIPHKSAFTAASGEAIYCDDLPKLQNEAYMSLVTSTKSHARIIEIDSTEALKCNGVCAFYSYKNLSKEKNRTGVFLDEELFASDVVECQGLVIGIIIADDPLIAQNAALKVKVTYQDLYPVIVTIEDAIRHNSFLFKDPETLVVGDIDAVFKEAPYIIEGDCRNGAQEHFYLETQSVLAVPKGEEQEMEIFSSTQNPASVTRLVGNLLDIPQNRIVTRVKRIGGAFGGKEGNSFSLAMLAAFAAQKLGRPVRCMLNRNEDMLITGKGHPYYLKYKTAFDKEGKILGTEVYLYSNAGYSKDMSIWVLERAMYHVENAYKIPVVKIVGYLCKTNLPSFTALRAFGTPQAMLAGETMIRQIAEFLNKDSVEIAYRNLYKEGDLTNYNQKLVDCNIERCWNECIASSNFIARREQTKTFNRNNRWRKRGISLVPVLYGVGISIPYLNQAGALVHVYTDGSVLLNHGGVEMGQGLHTKMIQIASTILQVPHTKIHICDTATDKIPNATGTIGSLSSDMYGSAVKTACEIIVERLASYKKQEPKKRWEDWVACAYKDRVSLSTTGFFKNLCEDFSIKLGTMYDYHTYGTACTEVEIDCLTGDHQILRTDIVMDVGKTLNPAIDIGQIEGAFTQGYGLFMQEEMLYSPKGEVLSTGPGTYKIPSFGNMPLEFNVSLLKDSSNPKAIFSSKAIGEPPLFLSCSVLFAVREAIKAARTDAGFGISDFKLHAPATAAKIRMACQDHITTLIEKNKSNDDFVPWNVVP